MAGYNDGVSGYFESDRRVFLSGYGFITITVCEGRTKTYLVNRIPVSEEEMEFISDALKSEAGELTVADFYPEKIKEILERVHKRGEAIKQYEDLQW